ncbi:MAG: lytic transglycosylase domain-containing protein [Thermodesulfobacteriota bacterium]
MLAVGLNRKSIKKAAVVIGLAVVMEAWLLPSFENNWHAQDASQEASMTRRGVVGYMSGVFSRNRTGLGPHEEVKLAEVILAESVRHKLDPLLVLALIKTESTYYNWSKSFSGAIGLMQIRPATGQELAGQLKLEWNGTETLLNPYLNVKMGVHYYSSLYARYNDEEKTLAAYNIGPGRLASRMRQNKAVSRNYADKVLSNYKDLKERADYYSYGG